MKDKIKRKDKKQKIPIQKKSLVDELVAKLKDVSNIKLKNIETKDEKQDMTSVVDYLKKCGLVVKKLPKKHNTDEHIEKINFKDIESVNKSLQPSEFSDNESEYEIETLEDEDSDYEYLEKIKQEHKTNGNQKHNDFIKIKSTTYLCVMCCSKFPDLKSLTNHISEETPCYVIKVPCPVCGKEFPNKSRCTSHMQSHKEKQKYFCDKCGKMFNTTISLSAHLEIMHTEYFDAIGDRFQCKLCDHIAETKQQVLQHININHLHLSTFLCDICGKIFTNETGLKVHIMIHRDTKPYLCQICSKAFKIQSSLRAHIKTHSQEKRFVCDQCGKSFKRNCTLRDHKKSHENEIN